jgi:predicted transcriptional regulator
MKKKKILVGVQSEQEMAAVAIKAWERAERGLPVVEPVQQLHFEDMVTLLKYLSPRRVELLQKLRSIGPTNIRKLAQILERDYKNIYTDVNDLVHIGLIEERERRFSVPWDEIVAKLPLVEKRKRGA